MEPQQNNPYTFITDPSRMTTGGLGNKSPQQRMLLGVAFIVVVLVVAVVALLFIMNLGKANNNDLIALRAHQAELLRIADIGLKGSTDGATRQTVSVIKATIASDQGRLSAYMTEESVKPSKEQLAQFIDTSRDESLEAAKQRGTYDAELSSLLKELATEYDRDIGKALEDSKTEEEKQLLNEARKSLTTIYAAQ